MRYFAYGSNLCVSRLRARVPSVQFVCVARLPAHVLCFARGEALDGSGKCNVFRTGADNDQVYGVVFELRADEKRLLDEIEGGGFGYWPVPIEVLTDAEPLEAFTYITHQRNRDDVMAPYDWYRDLVVHGATHYGLPAVYVSCLSAVEIQLDLDAERAEREYRYTRP